MNEHKTSRETGDIGEEIAVEFLKSHGYGIIARNYYASHAEIDVIAITPDGEAIVFCEVKSRSEKVAEKYGRPANAVGYTKQRHLIFAANQYIRKNPDICSSRRVRIDVIEVYLPVRGLPKVRHLQNAVSVRSEH